jgi:hypothetical protein
LSPNERRVLGTLASGLSPYQRVYVVPRDGGYVVCDGSSLAFQRSTHATLADAEIAATALAANAHGADTMIFDTDDPNDLPGWAV